MALITFNVAMDGNADQLSGALATANGAAVGDKGVRQLILSNPVGNGTVQFGPAPGGTFTTTPASIAAGATVTLGPFSNSAPVRLKEIFVKGTNTQTLNGTLISH